MAGSKAHPDAAADKKLIDKELKKKKLGGCKLEKR